jgi:hypothetical protein
MSWTKTSYGSQSIDLSGTTSTSWSVALTGAVSIGDVICVGTALQGGNRSITCDDNLGNTYTAPDTYVYDASSTLSTQNFYSIITNAGTPTITMHFASIVPEIVNIFSDHFTGETGVGVDGHNKNIVTTESFTTDYYTSGLFTTTNNGNLIWASAIPVVNGPSTTEPGTGYTLGQKMNADFGPGIQTVFISEYKIQSVAESINPSFTLINETGWVDFILAGFGINKFLPDVQGVRGRPFTIKAY